MSIGDFLRKAAAVADDVGSKATGAFNTVREAANDPQKLSDLGDKVGGAILDGIATGAKIVATTAEDLNKKPPGGDGPAGP